MKHDQMRLLQGVQTDMVSEDKIYYLHETACLNQMPGHFDTCPLADTRKALKDGQIDYP